MKQKAKSRKILIVMMMAVAIFMVCCNDDPNDHNIESGSDTEKSSRLYPDDLAYQGAFRVPRDKPDVNGVSVWYGRGYTYASTMNWDSKANSILMPGLSSGANYMGGFIPAQPIISVAKDAKEQIGRASCRERV